MSLLSRTAVPGEINEALELAKAYVLQETLGPIKGAGRFLGIGLAASAVMSVGVVLLVLGVLRLVQTETGDVFSGTWSFVPYLIGVAVCALAAGLAVWRVRSITLHGKESR